MRVCAPGLASQPGQYQKLAKDLAAVRPLVETGERYVATLREIEDSRVLQDDPDPEVAELAGAELQRLEGEKGARCAETL